MKRTRVKNKQPSLLRQIVSIHFEQAKRRKALRILNKQEWSVEFLEYLVMHAAQQLNNNIVIEVESPEGRKMRISSVNLKTDTAALDSDILNKLDDQAAVEAFIQKHAPVR